MFVSKSRITGKRLREKALKKKRVRKYCRPLSFVLSMVSLILLAFHGSTLADDMPGSNATKEIRKLKETTQQLKETTRALMQQVEELKKEVERYKEAAEGIQEVKEGQEELKKDVGEIQGIKEALGHIEFSGGITGVVQGSSGNDNNPPSYNDATNGAYSMDLNIATHFGRYGGLFIHLEDGDGDGINNDVASFSIPNYDAYSTTNNRNQADLTVSEAYYELGFLNEKALLDIGKMDISVLFDENEAAGDETTQFLSNIFVKSMGLTIPEPDDFYCPSAMLTWTPNDLVEFKVLGASVEGDEWEEILDNGFLATELTLRPKMFEMPGNYRIYGWWDGRRHLKNRYIGGNLTYSDGHENQKGWGISFDQEVFEGITGFVRYSQTDDNLSQWNGDEWEMIPFDRLWTVGVQLSGTLWQRERDAIGVAFGQTILTSDYSSTHAHSGNESYVESYYRIGLTDRFAISGDFQWINNAGGNSRADDIYILGVRTQLDF